VPTSRDNPAGPSIEELYGLEPVFEPGDGEAACAESLQSRTVQCPYCGEPFETMVDLSAGSATYTEDCQICCRPIELSLQVADDGELASLEPRRSD
jgi:Cysteine-rich CPXCG